LKSWNQTLQTNDPPNTHSYERKAKSFQYSALYLLSWHLDHYKSIEAKHTHANQLYYVTFYLKVLPISVDSHLMGWASVHLHSSPFVKRLA
jgi:hypothetical protein